MFTYFIKSAGSLLLLYGFYFFFLRDQKILLFNRFYLIFSLILSLVIPFIIIPVKTNFPVNNAFERINVSTEQFVMSNIPEISSPSLTLRNILTGIFILVSLLLIVRFAINLFRILRTIHINKKVHTGDTTIVLISGMTLPFSFFRYIFLNESDFENGKIEQELILHEEAHCEQYHSLDILIIEIINIFFWFNPVTWLIKKEIQLNHEYSADNKVLRTTDPLYYQEILLNLLLQNNLNNLVSNFKYSFMKNRLSMMTKSAPLNGA